MGHIVHNKKTNCGLQVTRLMDSAIAVKGAVESGLARELAVTLVHAPHFESKVRNIQAQSDSLKEGA